MLWQFDQHAGCLGTPFCLGRRSHVKQCIRALKCLDAEAKPAGNNRRLPQIERGQGGQNCGGPLCIGFRDVVWFRPAKHAGRGGQASDKLMCADNVKTALFEQGYDMAQETVIAVMQSRLEGGRKGGRFSVKNCRVKRWPRHRACHDDASHTLGTQIIEQSTKLLYPVFTRGTVGKIMGHAVQGDAIGVWMRLKDARGQLATTRQKAKPSRHDQPGVRKERSVAPRMKSTIWRT